jgi:hypothetical protein
VCTPHNPVPIADRIPAMTYYIVKCLAFHATFNSDLYSTMIFRITWCFNEEPDATKHATKRFVKDGFGLRPIRAWRLQYNVW